MPAECAHTDGLLNLVSVLEFKAQYLHVNFLGIFFNNSTFTSSLDAIAGEFGWESGREMREVSTDLGPQYMTTPYSMSKSN